MKKRRLESALALAAASAVIYMLLDLPVRLTGCLSYGSYIGIKNFLPFVVGLIFGPVALAGECLGCAINAAIAATPAREALFECASILIIGLGMWLTWHARSKTHKIHLKKPIHYLKYLASALTLSAIAALAGRFMVSGDAFLPVLAAHVALGILVGIPVNILLNGVLCVAPVLPPWCRRSPDFSQTLTVAGIDEFNERLEDFADARGLKRRQLFQIENCLEEIAIRVSAALPDAALDVRLDYDTTVSIRISYPGQRCSPLRVEKDEDLETLIGLELIKHRALRASYGYRSGENRLHIVI